MRLKLISIGNSLGVIIPKNALKEKNIKIGDKVEVEARFMKTVDEFIEDNKDVLKQLANR